jgi:hypothetical protein
VDLLPLSAAAAGARQEIRSLRANVTQQEALAALERRGGLLRGRLRQMASAYLPFRLYHVEVRNRGAAKVALYGADAVTGHLDLYEFATAPAAKDLITVTTRNGEHATLQAMDAVRRTFEGAKARAIFSDWLMAVPGEKSEGNSAAQQEESR